LSITFRTRLATTHHRLRSGDGGQRGDPFVDHVGGEHENHGATDVLGVFFEPAPRCRKHAVSEAGATSSSRSAALRGNGATSEKRAHVSRYCVVVGSASESDLRATGTVASAFPRAAPPATTARALLVTTFWICAIAAAARSGVRRSPEDAHGEHRQDRAGDEVEPGDPRRWVGCA
jgi:hypothetical protein